MALITKVLLICNCCFNKIVIQLPITMTNPKDAICTKPNNHNCGCSNNEDNFMCGCSFIFGLGARANQKINASNATLAVEINAPLQLVNSAIRGTIKITKPEPNKIVAP